jgi:hypothetical protein
MTLVVLLVLCLKGRSTGHHQQGEVDVSTEQAKAEYLAGSPFWAAELIAQLEGLASGAALLWATESVIELAKEAAPTYKDKFLDCVRELSSVTDEAAAGLMERADAIWSEGQDPFHKALSHLFAAKSKLLRGDGRFYRTHLVKALMFLGTDEHCRRTSATTPLTLFDKHMRANKRDD